jgi:hypothetical protein
MGILRIQWSLDPYLVSICFIELDVLRIPKSQIYHALNGDFFAYFLNLFVFNLLEVDSYKCNRGHQRYSIILPSISMLFYCIYMHATT